MKLNKTELSPIRYLNDSLDGRGIRQYSIDKVDHDTCIYLRTYIAHNIPEIVMDRAFTRYNYWNAIQI